jgi:hypothetical protein
MEKLPRSLSIALLAATLLLASMGADSRPQAQHPNTHLAYHDHAPTEPLPTTLDPEPFKENRVAFTAYALAAQIRETLYQVPCYCPCNKHQGHQSLLDCFRDNHGAKCHLCQQEAIFCFIERQKNPAQLRQALAHGEAWCIDLEKETARLSGQTQGHQR